MKKLTFLLLSLLLCHGCSKDDPTATPTPENPYHQNAEVAENVILILDENSMLLSSEGELSNGIYIIQFNTAAPEIKTNDIIVGNEGEGYLRKVTSTSVNGTTVTLQTSQAKLDDLFNNASIQFTTDISEGSRMSNVKTDDLKINYLRNGIALSDDGLNYNFANTILYSANGIIFKITNGTATFDPNFNFNADYTLLGGLDYLNFGTENASLTIDCDLSLNISGNASLPGFTQTLADFDKRITFFVAGVPVVMVVNTELVAELSAGVDANVLVTYGFTNNYSVSSGIKYENDSWSGNFGSNSSLTPKPIDFSGQVNISQNFTITPKVNVKFYGVVGPYCEPKMTEDFAFNVASPSLNWDSDLKVGLNMTTGVDITIFGYATDFSRTDTFEQTIWSAPTVLEIVSGNNQTGLQGEQLNEPLKVKVTDLLGNPLKLVRVYFTATPGSGTVGNTSVMTNSDGFAQTSWTLGNLEIQTLNAEIRNSNGVIISATVFNATMGDEDLTDTYKASIVGNWRVDSYDTNGVLYFVQHKVLTSAGEVYIVVNSPTNGPTETFDPPIYQENWTVVKDNLGYHLAINGAVYPYILIYPVTFINGGYPPYPMYVYTKE